MATAAKDCGSPATRTAINPHAGARINRRQIVCGGNVTRRDKHKHLRDASQSSAHEFGQVWVSNTPRNLLDRLLGYFIANTESDTENTPLKQDRDVAERTNTWFARITLQSVCGRQFSVRCTIPAHCFCVYPFNDYHCNDWDLRDWL